MNQNLPKPMLNALARQALPTDHPSADVLTAFAENALAGDEHRRIMDHLSRCGECREVLFLASGAAEKPLQVEDQVAAYGTKRRWTPRLVWGMSIAGTVLVAASALVWWRNESARPRMEMASSVPAAQPSQQAQESQPATEPQASTTVQTTANLAAPSPIAKPQTRNARAKSAAPGGAETLGVGSSAGIVAGLTPKPANAAPTTTLATKAVPIATGSQPNTIAVGGSAPTIGAASAAAPAAPHLNSFAAVQGGPVAGAVPGSADKLLMNPQAAVRSLRAPQWRITADGHLEHSTADGWTRVLADQTATFRVVSSVGNHVWVGGSSGALFHSRDSGQNWVEVSLTTPNGRETATIVAIQFDDSQHGTVTAENGTRCGTTDGGTSWVCQ